MNISALSDEPGDAEMRRVRIRRQHLDLERRNLLQTRKPTSDLELQRLKDKLRSIDAAMRACDERTEELFAASRGRR